MFGFLSSVGRAVNKSVDSGYSERKSERIKNGDKATQFKIQPHAPIEQLKQLQQIKAQYGRESETYRSVKKDVYREAAENKRMSDIRSSAGEAASRALVLALFNHSDD